MNDDPARYLLCDRVGFNYVAATLDLLRAGVTYERLAEALGYKSKGAISRLLEGSIPSHVQGEALWAFYCATFSRKPPMAVHQSGQQMASTA